VVAQQIAEAALPERQALAALLEVLVVWVRFPVQRCLVSTVTQPRSQVKHASSAAVVVVAVGQATEPGSTASAARAAAALALTASALLALMVCQIPVAVEVPEKLTVQTVEQVALE
jgi:uridylate kinase